jgi:predicted DNA-binding WGR domain protein
MRRIAGLLGQRQRRRAAAVERLADAFRAADEIDVAQHRFHFGSADGKCAAVHAALHAAVDPLFQCADLVLARDIRREDAPDAGQWQSEALRSGLEMAGLAIQTVAAVAHGRVGCVGTDQRRCFHDQIPAAANGAAESIVWQRVRIGHGPRRRCRGLRSLRVAACRQQCRKHDAGYDSDHQSLLTSGLIFRPLNRDFPGTPPNVSLPKRTVFLADRRDQRT